MNLEDILQHCTTKPGVEETFPFGPETLVLKVYGKIFLLADLENAVSINLKCNPEKAVELREKYHSVQPGYHMNKKHWNTVMLNGTYSRKELLEWIDDSYALVFNSLPAKTRTLLAPTT